MSEMKHPSEMNMLQHYARAVKLAKTTSRMKNQAWYQDALELDVQLHCYLKDAAGMTCYLRVKSGNHFEKIDGLSSRQLEQRDELVKLIDNVLAHEAAAKAKSIGIIFYLADEFSIAGLGPEHQNPAELTELREMMLEDPIEVLDDKTISAETHSWRLFPYPGAAAGDEYATGVAVSKRRNNTLKTLREIGNEKNLPIRTCALSAPLCAITLMPWFSTAKENGTISLFNYEGFTLIAFFNTRCDLLMLRCMPHANNDAYPANIGSAIMATAAAFELEDPEIMVFSMVGHELDVLKLALRTAILGADVTMVDAAEVIKDKGLPMNIPLECIATTQDLDTDLHPLGNNETFTSFQEDSWHLQDFLSPDVEELEMHPGQADMKLLKIGKRIKKIAALLLLGILMHSTFSIISKVKNDAWSYKAENLSATNIALTAELKKYELWDNLLMDRSKAWVTMELIAQLTPSNGTVILDSVNHTVDQKEDKANNNIGFTKKWLIQGFASDKGIELLEQFSTREGIKGLFLKVALETQNNAYLPEVNKRDLTVSLRQRSNPSYNTINPKKPGDTFRRAFTISITQTISGEDEMALASLKDTLN